MSTVTSPNEKIEPCAALAACSRRDAARTRASKLAHTKGLGQVVIGAGIQCLDLVLLTDAGREHDNGHLGPAAHIRE